MKTSKRKRSSAAAKATPAVAAPDVAVAEEPTVELSAAAVEALVAEAGAEPVVDADAETVVVEAQASVASEPVVVLAANCSVKDAAALKTSLCAVATQSTAVTLDVSAVERVDTATMQLLCAFVRARGGRNQSVTWRGESQALKDAVRLLGVGALLGFDSNGVAA